MAQAAKNLGTTPMDPSQPTALRAVLDGVGA